jgi:hypothetical protein
MAISATTQRKLEIALGDRAAAAAICDAIDSNTTLLAAVAAINASSSDASTTWLESRIAAIAAAATAS